MTPGHPAWGLFYSCGSTARLPSLPGGRYSPARAGSSALHAFCGGLITTTAWVIIGVIVVLIAWIIMIYNGLVAMRQRVGQAFADIDVQLKQRHDLIPNLVETVKGYATHERGT